MSAALDIYRELSLDEMRNIPMEMLFEHLDWLAAETDRVLDMGEQAMAEFETALKASRTPEEDAFIKAESDAWYRRTAPTVASIEDGAVALFNSRMKEAQTRIDVRG